MDAPCKIAIISTSFPPRKSGGVETSHFNLMNAFLSRGYNVRAFTFCDSYSGKDERGVVRRGVPDWFGRKIRSSIFFGLRLLGERGDVYQAADAAIGSIGALSLIGELKRFSPDVTIIPDMGAPFAFFPRISAKTILVAHHNPARFLHQPFVGPHSERDVQLALYLEKLALKRVNAVVCPSRYMAKIFSETYPFEGPLEVIPNLVVAELVDKVQDSVLHRKMGLAADSPVVYIPSAGSIYKGSRFVFELIRRLAGGVHGTLGFYLTGKIDPELSACLQYVPDNARIYTPGHISYLENIHSVRECSFCLSPTIVENFGMALLEAQHCGLPVVTFDVGGNEEIVDSERTGYVVPFLDVDGLVEVSLRLLKEPGLLMEMGKTAKLEARRRFNEDIVIDNYLDLFRKITHA